MGQAGIYENKLRSRLVALGLRVIRSAGSMGEGDLIVVRPRPLHAIVLEVKASKDPRLGPAEGAILREQFESYLQQEEEGLDVWYAYYLKRQKEPWRFFRPREAIGGGKRGGRAFVWENGRTLEAWRLEVGL